MQRELGGVAFLAVVEVDARHVLREAKIGVEARGRLTGQHHAELSVRKSLGEVIFAEAEARDEAATGVERDVAIGQEAARAEFRRETPDASVLVAATLVV